MVVWLPGRPQLAESLSCQLRHLTTAHCSSNKSLVVGWAVVAQWLEHWWLKPATWVQFPVTRCHISSFITRLDTCNILYFRSVRHETIFTAALESWTATRSYLWWVQTGFSVGERCQVDAYKAACFIHLVAGKETSNLKKEPPTHPSPPPTLHIGYLPVYWLPRSPQGLI